ncbi:DedA family protein [Microvirga thermotolerans]|uniref:DedA family protein n=1 Tax=Microvirga thermotolerans TaxID=2651334 RepID=A0A5P9JXS9_9HYPH|nr:DedA family protein [Microvirga thermotolerans]QFU16035.1 DedA family protein [Microvirga thermotolerans]
MNLEDLTQAVLDFIRAHRELAPLILGLMTFGESFAFVSLLLPATTVIVAAGFLIAAAEIPFWQSWAGAVAGAILGNWISYAVGRHYKTAAYGVWPLSRKPGLIARGERFFERFGPWAVFFGRFFGPARAVIPLIAGIFLMPAILFQAANLASAFVWGFVLLAPGAGLARHFFW